MTIHLPHRPAYKEVFILLQPQCEKRVFHSIYFQFIYVTSRRKSKCFLARFIMIESCIPQKVSQKFDSQFFKQLYHPYKGGTMSRVKCLSLLFLLLLMYSTTIAAEYTVPQLAYSVYAEDLDLDGDKDIVVGHKTRCGMIIQLFIF